MCTSVDTGGRGARRFRAGFYRAAGPRACVRRATALALAGLAVLAGCGGFAADRRQATLSPAPVPSESPTASPTATPAPTVAPGVTRRRLADPVALVEAHAARLQATNYTVRVNRTVRYENGTLRNRRRKVTRVADQGNRYRRRIAVEGRVAPPPVESPPGRVEQWSDGVWLFSRVTTAGRTTYRALHPDQYDRVREYYRPLPDRDALVLALSAVEKRVRPADGGGYRVVATRLARPAQFALAGRADRPRNLTLSMHVTPRGVVRSMHVAYEGTVDGAPVTVTRTVRYGDLGTTVVERPAWVDEARAAADGGDRNGSGDGTPPGR